MFTITRATLTFYLRKKVLWFLHFQKTETQLFLYQHLCPCVPVANSLCVLGELCTPKAK